MKKTLIIVASIVIVFVGAGIWYSSNKEGIKVLSPSGGETWSRGQKVQILWNAAKEITSVNIRLVILGNEDSQNFNAAIASDVPNTGEYEWIVQELYAEAWGTKALPLSDKYLVTIENKDHNNIYDTSDATFSIKYLFINSNGKYSFEYPPDWQVAINQYNNNNSLFGPGANSGSGKGGVEVFDSQKSIDIFLNGVDATYTKKKDITIDGISGIYTHYKGFPASGVEAVLLKNNKIYNIYINSEENADIELFNQIISTFKFIDETEDWQTYRNEQYGFTLALSRGWQEYTVVTTNQVEYGWKIIIRNPQWTEASPYEDIPILIYPIEQWIKWEANNFEDYPTAAPFGPLERGRNAKYVFATAPRYNYDYRTGWEDVENIIKTLKAF